MDKQQTKIYEFGDFRIDAGSRRLIKGAGDEQVPLTPKVFETLLFFVENQGRVIEKEELMAAIWTDTIVEENNLSQNISILRRVLGEKRGEHRFIATIPGRGFKFVAEVVNVEAAETQPAESLESLADLQTPGVAEPEISSLISNDEIKIQPSESTARRAGGNPETKNRNKILIAGAALILLCILLAAIYLRRGSENEIKPVSSIKTIAVLPFKPIVANSRDEALEMGMADTLIARLGSNREIVVRPLSSVRKFGNLEQDAQAAGRELGVESVLDGSIQRVQDKIRVNVRLIGTADGATLWNDTFDEDFTDIFLVQDTISQKVAAALAVRLSVNEKKYLSNRSTENVEAYRFYLQGRYHSLKLTPPEIRQGIEFYKQAIDLDPLYALALAGMAQAYASLPITSDVPPNDAFPQAKAAADKALEIDPDLAEARIVLGVVDFWFEWDWANAEAELKKVIAVSPNNADAHRFYSVLLTVLGRHDEAIAEMEAARRLDPLSLVLNTLKGQAFFYAGRDAEAIDQLNKTLEIEPNFWIAHVILAKIYIRQNNFNEAVIEAKKAEALSGGNSEAASLAGYALAKAERHEESSAILKELKSKSEQRYVPAYNLAMIENGLGNRAAALDNLEKAFQERDARMILLKVEPKWNNLHREPRFVDLMQQLNLQ